jgi:hypothetical protein
VAIGICVTDDVGEFGGGFAAFEETDLGITEVTGARQRSVK